MELDLEELAAVLELLAEADFTELRITGTISGATSTPKDHHSHG